MCAGGQVAPIQISSFRKIEVVFLLEKYEGEICMNEKEILEKINSILDSAKEIAENNVDMDDFEMEIDVPEKL